MSAHILVVPFQGQGHLFPSTELCKHLSHLLNYKVTLVIPSFLSSSLPSHSLFQIIELSSENDPLDHHHQHNHGHGMAQPFYDLLSILSNGPDPPICVIVDVMMNWINDSCRQFKIPTVSFLTSGACSAAMEFALSKLGPENLTSGETRMLPGLPEDMCVTLSDLDHRRPPRPLAGGFLQPPPLSDLDHRRPPPPPAGGFLQPPPGPPCRPWGHRPWLSQTDGSVALMINTCDDLERLFINFIAKETGKRIFCVGPLLPEQYWQSTDSLVRDRESRSKRDSNISEDDVKEWLDSKPRGSVFYVSFGTEVGPTVEELVELAVALQESNRPFIWVLQAHAGRPGPGPPGPPGNNPGFFIPLGGSHEPPSPSETSDFLPEGFANRVDGRGLIIRGWAPQLLILSHPSTAGFISHCGWNSTLEAIVRGVPLLTWPIRGDQHYNAKLVVSHLKVGLKIKVDGGRAELIKRDDILLGMEKLMADDETRKRAASLQAIFDHGFPASSMASLESFRDFINQIAHLE